VILFLTPGHFSFLVFQYIRKHEALLLCCCMQKILGRSDRVDLPELGLKNIHAKIDTGAYTCSLHCHRAEIVNGCLEFILLDEEHPEFTGMKFIFKEFEKREIKNSFGEVENRFVIVTTIRIFDEDIRAEFSLSNRGLLTFPILIGRKILRDRYLIDVKEKNLSFREKRKKLKIQKQKRR
jgi:hypothetical protein